MVTEHFPRLIGGVNQTFCGTHYLSHGAINPVNGYVSFLRFFNKMLAIEAGVEETQWTTAKGEKDSSRREKTEGEEGEISTKSRSLARCELD